MIKNRIIQLDPIVANQIAAGEVVERPASVVKELIENSLDAFATKIEIEIEGGGMHLIRIRDNGNGILKEDLNLAFSRHATSKIRSSNDLYDIHSLGFRGEALASIASVAQCRLTSKVESESSGWQIQIGKDLSQSIYPAAHLTGTTIEVADLFYNTPVRRKFLRSEKTEFQYIEDIIKRLALAHPQVSFLLKHQQRQIKYFPRVSDSKEKVRVGKICGEQFVENAIQISVEATGLSLKGWLGLPQVGRRQADCQFFFVNQRIVKDRLLNHVIKTVYLSFAEMIEGSYPCYVLYLNLDPKEIDVNVHPTKQEIRFANPRLIHDFMIKSIHQSFEKNSPLSSDSTFSTSLARPLYKKTEMTEKLDSIANWGHEILPDQVNKDTIVPTTRYACVEEKQGLIIIDLKMVKSELVSYYFEKNWNKIVSKALLFPQNLMLNSTDRDELENQLASFGFVVKLSKKRCSFLQQPAFLNKAISPNLLLDLIAFVKSTQEKQAIARFLGEHLHDCSEIPQFDKLLTEWVSIKNSPSLLRLTHQRIVALRKGEQVLNFDKI